MALVTFESVATAAAELQQQGQRASIRAVQKVLGGGSPNSILAFLREWQAGRPLVRTSDIELDERITSAIRAQMQAVAADAAQAAEERAGSVEDDLQALAEAQREAEATIAAQAEAAAAAAAQIDTLTDELAQAQDRAERVEQQHAELVAELRAQIAAERARADAAATALTTATVRLEEQQARARLEVEAAELRGRLAAKE